MRVAIVAQCQALNAGGLNLGTAGNISVALGDNMLITPSAVPYDADAPGDDRRDADPGRIRRLVGPAETLDRMALPSRHHARAARRRRDRAFSSDLRLRAGDAAQADSRRPLHDRAVRRPDREMREIRALRHEGTRPTSSSRGSATATPCCSAITARWSPARDLDHAMNLARELENLAHMYYLAISAGRPAILSDDEVMRTVERFKSYGAGVEAPKIARPKRAQSKPSAFARRNRPRARRRRRVARARAERALAYFRRSRGFRAGQDASALAIVRRVARRRQILCDMAGSDEAVLAEILHLVERSDSQHALLHQSSR